MEGVVVSEFSPYSAVDQSRHGLQEDLYESYLPVVAIYLWQDNKIFPCAIGRQGPVPESGLDQVHDPLPVLCLQVLLSCRCCKPPLEAIHPNLRWSARPVAEDMKKFPLALAPVGDRIVYGICIYTQCYVLVQGEHTCVQSDPLHYNLGDGDTGGGKWPVSWGLVPSTHPLSCLFYKEWVRHKEELDRRYCLRHSSLFIPVK